MQINGSVFVVTGAGSGLGAETASNLVSAGGKVVIVDIDAAAGEAQAAQLGASARFVKTDVTDEASATAAIETAVKEFGGLHGLVNCAGVAPPKKVLGRNGPHDLATFARVVSINLVGTFNMIRLAADAMSKNEPNDKGERGVIVCGSGVGASVAANKVRGVRAVLSHDTYSAHQGVEHDAVNVLCLGGRIIGGALACEVVDAFLNAKYSGEERHERRLQKVLDAEARF